MDIVPYLTEFHNDYDSTKHEGLLSKIRECCSNKELVLVTSEQLSRYPCPYSYNLLLPLIDLSLPYNARWLGKTFAESLFVGDICEACSECPPNVSYLLAIVHCISNLDTSHSSVIEYSDFENVMLHCIDEDRTSLTDSESSCIYYDALRNFDLIFSSIICSRYMDDSFDPASIIVCSQFCFQPPCVYNISWLFGRVLPWLLMLSNDVENVVECAEAQLLLSPAFYFSSQSFTVSRSDFENFRELIGILIRYAINNTTESNRQGASRAIRSLSMKLRTSDQLRLIEEYLDHENSSVTGLFIDQFKRIVSQKNMDLTNHRVLKICRLLLRFDMGTDILKSSDKILATLSLVQFVGLKRVPLLRVETLKEYVQKVTTATQRAEFELDNQEKALNKHGSALDNVPAALIQVGNETVKEPSLEESRESISLSKCRLDLIFYNLAKTRDALE